MAKKKTTSKKKKTDNNRLSKSELAYFQKILLLKRREIFGDVHNMEGDALKKSRIDASGDLSSMPIHMADIGTDNYEQEFALGLVDSEVKLLKAVDAALIRINKGRYGKCLGTGKPIGKARLEAKPWAKYCVEYAEKLEQGLAEEIEEEFED